MAIEIDHTGTRALVTGAGAGIGAEIARWLACAGASVAVHDVRPDKAAEVVASIAAMDGWGPAFPIIANARDDAALEAMIDQAATRLGGLDVAVNNVGMYGEFTPGPFATLDAAHWRGLLNQNLVITALAGAAEARHMIAGGKGGVILNVSSGETTRPAPFMAAYGAAKAAINHLTQTMAVELGPSGIRVIAIAPGTTLTENVREVFNDDHVAALVEATPLRRLTEPDELARLAVFLTSDLARCITGQLILADAGAHLSRNRPANRAGIAREGKWIDMSAAKAGLVPVREILEPDGADVELVGVDGGTVLLRLRLENAACADTCVIPRAMLETLALQMMLPFVAGLTAVTIDDPRESPSANAAPPGASGRFS